MPKRIGMTLSICNYKQIYICIVVAQDCSQEEVQNVMAKAHPEFFSHVS
jgi:hypothetical protein